MPFTNTYMFITSNSASDAHKDQVQFSSVAQSCLFATPWIAAHQASLSITNSWSLPKLLSIESVMPSSHLILCHPLLLLHPIPPSIRVFSNESFPESFPLCMRWPKYWSFSFSIIPPPEKSQGWSPSEWIGWISLQSKGLSRVFFNTTVQFKSINSAALSLLHSPTLTSIRDHRKNQSLDCKAQVKHQTPKWYMQPGK